jgi:hypothetical protein
MWGRVVELMLGLWLVLSPFIFGHDTLHPGLWRNDFACGVAIVLLALLSFWHTLRHVHLLNLLVAAWLIGFGYIYGGYPSPPGAQNNILLGLILLLFAIIPNEANQPPPPWRHYYWQQARAQTSSMMHTSARRHAERTSGEDVDIPR